MQLGGNGLSGRNGVDARNVHCTTSGCINHVRTEAGTATEGYTTIRYMIFIAQNGGDSEAGGNAGEQKQACGQQAA